jgi:SAM-dependent methyltransferase
MDSAEVDRMFTQEFWDERYGSVEHLWSGEPNQRFAENVADRIPGTALDVACGEGADAIWLAARGWQVTAVDVSPVALRRAAQRADAAGADVAARITWQQADVRSWDPAPAQFDLVSSQFMHLPSAVRAGAHKRLAAAVRPGGMLLIIGHHPSDLHSGMPRPDLPDLFFTAEDEAALLDPSQWSIDASAPERTAATPHNGTATIRDAVLRAVRRDTA